MPLAARREARRHEAQRLNIVILGLSLSSSWGNGHATTYRALLRGLAARGHRVLFLERDVPWYAGDRDLPRPDFCRLEFYRRRRRPAARFACAHRGSRRRHRRLLRAGRQSRSLDLVLAARLRLLCFYDIDTPDHPRALGRGD